MKVICAKETLLKGIQIVSPVASSRPALPVLANFLFEAKEDKIMLSSTDLEIAVKCYIKGEIITEGGITIPARKFADIVKELSDENSIEIHVDKSSSQITIISGASRFNLSGISREEYPVIPDFLKDNNFSIKRDNFVSILKKTVFAVSKEETQKVVLKGLYFVVEEGKLKIVATDGRRLALAISDDIDSSIKTTAIAAAKSVAELIRLLGVAESKDEMIKVAISENRYAVEFEDITFISTLLEGIYPNYQQVIPEKTDYMAKLNLKDTLTAVKQISLLAEKSSNATSQAIKFSFTKNTLKISAATAGVGSAQTEIKIDYDDDDAEVNFPPNHIREFLQNVETEFINFGFSATGKPAKITPEKDEKYLYVVMPMRG
ncbi:MAG: DNA polymerase III subunit beta [Elusimicrobiota bacterium]|nr:DNA polymerase III subunit beta [Elusimicrobiota bacterium]